MAHHKRGKPKNSRAGCLLCKPHKMNGWKEGNDLSHSNQRKEFIAKVDVKEIGQQAVDQLSKHLLDN